MQMDVPQDAGLVVAVELKGRAANDGEHSELSIVGRLSMGEMHPISATVVNAAAIEEIRKTPKRASPRLAKYNDVDSTKKAKKRAAWKNLDFSGGNTSN